MAVEDEAMHTMSDAPDDDNMNITKTSAPSNSSDTGNLAMLFMLYFIHAIPLAFSLGTMPILLREQTSYLVVGSFALTQYPYSLKILWSPIVETLHFSWLGSKKSWLVPGFLADGLLIFWLSWYQDDLIQQVAAGSSYATFVLIAVWSCMGFCNATIRVTLDSWALELVSPANLRWFSTTVTMAEVCGYFVSFNLFLGLSGLRKSSASDDKDGVTYGSVHGFFLFITISCLLTGSLLFLRREPRQLHKQTLRHKYGIIIRILRLPQVWTLFAVHLISLVGFVTNDTVTTLQLVKNGFSESDLALIATLDTPFLIGMGILVPRFLRNRSPLEVWRQVFPFRLMAAVVAQCGVMLVYIFRDHPWRFYIAIVPDSLTWSLEIAMFICLITYHAEVSDSRHGAIYLPLLATMLDLRYAILQFIVTKVIGLLDAKENAKVATRLFDGYQIVSTTCVLLAIPLFYFYLRPATIWLQGQRQEKWRVDPIEPDYERIPLEDQIDQG